MGPPSTEYEKSFIYHFPGKLQCQAKSVDVSLPDFPVIGSYRGRRTVTVFSGGNSISCIQGKTQVPPGMRLLYFCGPGL